MTYERVKQLMERVDNDGLLSKQEQAEVLKSILRANHRIRDAKNAGFDPDQIRREARAGA